MKLVDVINLLDKTISAKDKLYQEYVHQFENLGLQGDVATFSTMLYLELNIKELKKIREDLMLVEYLSCNS